MENFNLNKGGAGGQQPPAGGSPADRAVGAKAKKEKPMKQPKDPNAKGSKSTMILLGVLLLVAIGGGAFYMTTMNKEEAPIAFTPMKRPPMAGKIKPGKGKTGEAVGTSTATEELSMAENEKTGKTGSSNSELKTSDELEKKPAKKTAAAEAPAVEKPAVEKTKTEKALAPKAEKPKATAEKKKRKPSVVIAQTPSSSYESYTPRPRYKKASSTRKATAAKRKKTYTVKYNYGSEMVPAVAWKERGAMAVPRIPGRIAPPPISKPSSYGLSGYADVYSWSPSGMPDAPPPLRTYPSSNEFSGPGRPSAPGAGFSKMSEYHKVVVVESSSRNEIDRVKMSLTRHNLVPEVMSYEAGGTTYYELSVGHYTSKTMAMNKANEIASEGFPARVVSEKVYH